MSERTVERDVKIGRQEVEKLFGDRGGSNAWFKRLNNAEKAVALVWSLNFERLHLTSSQSAACDAVRNKLLDSYREVREAPKQREMSGRGADNSGGRGKKKNPPQLTGEGFKEGHKHAGETSAVRARAAHTNREYIDMAQ